MKSISILNLMILGSIAAMASGCGNMYGSSTKYSASSLSSGVTGSLPTSTVTLGATTQGKYSCPSSNNVTPQAQAYSTATGFFKVCIDPSSETDVIVDGTFGNSDQVCMFPIEETQAGTDQEYAYWEPDPSSAAPWYICQPGSSTGSVFTFNGLTTNWNAAYIVDAAYATQMQTCLIFGSGTQECPSYPQYSFGEIR